MTTPNIIEFLTDDQQGWISIDKTNPAAYAYYGTLARGMPNLLGRCSTVVGGGNNDIKPGIPDIPGGPYSTGLTLYPNGFCAGMVCEPARASLNEGRYHWNSRVHANQDNTWYDEAHDFANALPAVGYTSMGYIGKVFTNFPNNWKTGNVNHCPEGYTYCCLLLGLTANPYQYSLIEGTGCVFIGNISGVTLTVTSMIIGTITNGMLVTGHDYAAGGAAGGSIIPGTTLSFGGTGSGGVGTYTLSLAQASFTGVRIAGSAVVVNNTDWKPATTTATSSQSGNVVTITALTGTVHPNSTITASGVTAAIISPYGTGGTTGTGGNGTYWVSVSQSYTNKALTITPDPTEQDTHHITYVLGLKCSAFITAHSGEKFFLKARLHGPHDPASPMNQDANTYTGENVASSDTSYNPVFCKPTGTLATGLSFYDGQTALVANTEAAAVNAQERAMLAIDRAIAGTGGIFPTLQAQGILANTVFFYSTDQGITKGNWNMDSKRDPHDSVTRVPFFAYWGTYGDAPGINPKVVSHIDLVPTYAALTGATPIVQPDGINILSGSRSSALCHWVGGTAAGPNEDNGGSLPTYACQGYNDADATPAFLCLEDPNYSYVSAEHLPVFPASQAPTATNDTVLFDLKADPFESTDVSGSHSSQVAAMGSSVANTFPNLMSVGQRLVTRFATNATSGNLQEPGPLFGFSPKDGDLLVAIVSWRGSANFTAPAGWTQRVIQNNGDTATTGAASLGIWSIEARSGTPNLSWTRGASGSRATGTILCFRPKNTTVAFDAAVSNTETSATQQTPSTGTALVTVKPNELVIAAAAVGRLVNITAMNSATFGASDTDTTGSNFVDVMSAPQTDRWTINTYDRDNTGPNLVTFIAVGMKSAAGSAGVISCSLSAGNKAAMGAVSFESLAAPTNFRSTLSPIGTRAGSRQMQRGA